MAYPKANLENLGAVQNRRGTSVTFHPDPEIFGKTIKFKAKRLYAMAKSKAYLFSGVEIRWKVDPRMPRAIMTRHLLTDTFRFPNGLADYLNERLEGSSVYSEIPFAGKVQFSEKFGQSTIGNIEWAINWTPSRDSFHPIILQYRSDP